MEKYHGNTVEYWKQNAEENYLTTPISVLKYITVLEEQAEQLRKHAVSGRSEQLKAIEELIDLAQDCCPAERIDYLHNIINRL